MFLTEARAITGAVITLVLSVVSLTNLPFPHIMRAKFLRPVTAAVTVVWIAAMVYATFTYPNHPYVVRLLLVAGSGYFAVLVFVKLARDMRQRQAPDGPA